MTQHQLFSFWNNASMLLPHDWAAMDLHKTSYVLFFTVGSNTTRALDVFMCMHWHSQDLLLEDPGFSTANANWVLQHKLLLSAQCTSIVLFHTCLKLFRFSSSPPFLSPFSPSYFLPISFPSIPFPHSFPSPSTFSIPFPTGAKLPPLFAASSRGSTLAPSAGLSWAQPSSVFWCILG